MNQDPLRRRLADLVAGAEPAGGDLELLARALLGQPDRALDCATCRERLPGYVHAESSGLDVARLYPDMRAHLLLCPECEGDYIQQLDLAWKLAREAIPRAPSRPAMPMIPTTISSMTEASPTLSRIRQSRMVRRLSRTTTAASVALPSGSRTPSVRVTRSRTAWRQPSNRMP